SVPFGAASWTRPSASAIIAAKACSRIAGLAFSSGASDKAAGSERNLVVHVVALAGARHGGLSLPRNRAPAPPRARAEAALAALASTIGASDKTADSVRTLVVHLVALAGARHGGLALTRPRARAAQRARAEVAAAALVGPHPGAATAAAVEHGEGRVEALQHH